MTKTINISLPEELLKQIDLAAKDEYATRSDYIREALVRKLRGQRIVDEWGDAGEWKTMIDFKEVASDGVPAADVLSALEGMARKHGR
jgi:Arc/MetJ-type ribon-helix-helix transcriptional regulator